MSTPARLERIGALLAVICGGASCTCRNDNLQARDVETVAVLQMPSSNRALMKKMLATLGEVRGRVAAGVQSTAPAAVLHRQSSEIAASGVPEGFLRGRSELLRTTKALRSNGSSGDYGAVVDTCIGCHRTYGPKSLYLVEALRLPRGK